MGTWRGTYTHVGTLSAVASARRMAMGDEAKRRQQAQELVVAWLLCVVLDGGWVPLFFLRRDQRTHKHNERMGQWI